VGVVGNFSSAIAFIFFSKSFCGANVVVVIREDVRRAAHKNQFYFASF